MRSIESRKPGVLGTPRRRNAQGGIANFTPVVDRSIIDRAETRAGKDGFSYFRDLIVVLMSLYGRGSLSRLLERDMASMIRAWAKRSDAAAGRHVVKRNFKLRRDVYERAVARWKRESSGLTATAMFAFLLESYAESKIEFALRRGQGGE